jgi:hypothetical protein
MVSSYALIRWKANSHLQLYLTQTRNFQDRALAD